MKLYRVTCRGMSGGLGYDTVFGVAYAVANEQIGFDKDREMKSIELLADEAPYPACAYRLYLPEEPTHA